MNNVNIKLHYYQIELVKRLAETPALRFNDLLIEGLESEHMNYHLKQLIDQGLVEKINSNYALTDSGKDYCNLMDSETEIIEKQPKTSIIIWGVRKNKKGEIEHLLNKRLRQPYYGKIGRITGKVKFGETLKEAAARELYEEAGLKAKSLILENIYHKLRKRENGDWVQDVIFYIFFCKGFSGKFIPSTPIQENFWITKSNFLKRQDLDLFDDFEIDDRYSPRKLWIRENVDLAQGF
jgi:ADP-ribose pyrophosphatase YjhB (NUDIX family)